MTAHVLMRDLGRDAVWFDYIYDPAAATPAFVAKFDLVLLDAPGRHITPRPSTSFPAAATASPPRPSATRRPPTTPSPPKAKLLAAVGLDRVASWEKFLAQREPEQREARPTIANYEKRAGPSRFNFRSTVKGSDERTQVAADLRLELFAGEPDISKPIFMAWDERGRLWIAEARDYPHDVKPDGLGTDSDQDLRRHQRRRPRRQVHRLRRPPQHPTGFTFARRRHRRLPSRRAFSSSRTPTVMIRPTSAPRS